MKKPLIDKQLKKVLVKEIKQMMKGIITAVKKEAKKNRKAKQ